MKARNIRLHLGVIVARDEQARKIRRPLADMEQLKLKQFVQIHDANDFLMKQSARVIILDYELCGASGIYGLAELMSCCECPVILITKDCSEWELQQFEELGVMAVLGARFHIEDLGVKVEQALKFRERLGSSDRLPIVN
ncbi:hypothetical protein OAU50_02380 [Planctomycetota bacterium]|nr:hypothetical protein [Planctomycetota bacterium]